MHRWIRDSLVLIGLAMAILAPSQALAGTATYNAGRCYCTDDPNDTSTGEAPNGQFKATDSITMSTTGNGDTSDWQSIINDPDQVVCDDSSGNDEDGSGVNDRDTIVQSTGRDLEGFAFGWDTLPGSPTGNELVKFFTARYASTSNVQSFAYYGDVDGDNLLTSSDIVIGVTWSGANRTIYVGMYQYSPVDANGLGGDCLHDWDPTGLDGDPDTPDACDGTGYVDGYDMPGTFSFLGCSSAPPFNNSKCEAKTGEGGGVQMEFAATWSDLLQNAGGSVSPGYPIIFHVSSSNTSLGAGSWPSQIDDNLGGCGGFWGTSQFADGSCSNIGDSDSVSAVGTTRIEHFQNTALNQGWVAIQVDNDSNGPDTFDISAAQVGGDWVVNDSGATSTQQPTWEFFLDLDADDILDDPAETGTPVTATSELSEDGVSGETETVFARYTMPGVNNAYDPYGDAGVTVTFTSQVRSAFSMSCDNTVTAAPMPDFVLTKTSLAWSDPLGNSSPDAYEIPGSVIEYVINVENQGGGSPDAGAFWVSDPFPAEMDFAVGTLTCNDHANGPVCLTDSSSESSGLDFSATYAGGLSDATDWIEFSNTSSPDPLNDAHWLYTPTDPDLDGYDPAVTAIRVRPPAASTDQMNPRTSTTVGDGLPFNPSFTVTFRMKVQ